MAAERPPLGGACDVLIIGGGVAGLAVAIELGASTPLEVLVAEASGAPAERFGETLPPGAFGALHRLALSEAFRAGGHLRCPGAVSRWGSDRTGHNDFILDPLGPAWHIDRARFEVMLRVRARQAGATVLTRTRAVALTSAGDGFDVVLADASTRRRRVRPRWVVDASGPRAWFARQQGARPRRQDRLVAVVRAAGLGPGSFTAQTMLESAPAGWWYAARLPGDRLVTLLLTTPEAAASLTRDRFAGWYRESEATGLLGPRLAGCSLREEQFRVRAVPVSILDRLDGERWLAVGDAARSLDPIAGRGIYQAMAEAADAAWTIAAAAGVRQPPSWRYADRVRQRYADHLVTRTALYGQERRWPEAPFWRGARQAGTTGTMIGADVP